MRPALILAVSIALPATVAFSVQPAAAQSPDLEAACVSVAKNFLLSPVLNTGVVQSFPELTPPGARLTYSTRQNPEPTDFNNEVECIFKNTTAPLELVQFCMSDTCYSQTAEEPEQRRRFEEVNALMSRKD
jgi:hypothetical protein